MGASNRSKQKKKVQAPAFDETALAQLTSKIDKTLPTVTEKQDSPKRKRKHAPDDERKSKRRQTGAEMTSQNQSNGPAHKKAATSSSSALLDEILALGGDEADLELVANIDSDDEGGNAPQSKESGNISIDKSFQDELAKFASSLGFDSVRQEDDATADEESEEDVSSDEEEIAPPEPAPQEPAPEVRNGKQSGKLVFEPRSDWYGVKLDGFPSTPPDDIRKHASSLANLKAYAEKLLSEDASRYGATRASSSSQKFMSTIMSSGTLSDKVSALTLSIQESPVHSCKAFESLIGLAGKRSRGQAIAALSAVVDLLGNGAVLPSDRRLRTFATQPALLWALEESASTTWTEGKPLPKGMTPSHLIAWAYEDWLKAAYFRIIQLLEVWCADEIEYSRSRALDFVFGLLRDKPEQEANLLRLMVNKLGDRERKIASRASYLILQLLNVHPAMKAIVINTIEQEVLLKPGQSLRTRYCAINTLNQTILSTREPAIADALLRVYFDLFVSLLKSGSLENLEAPDTDVKEQGGKGGKKFKSRGADVSGNEQETAQKLVSSLLTGVNRAVPFAAADESTLEKHLDTLFKISHSSNFNTSIQALMLIQQVASTKYLAVDRFYRTLYESLLDPRLITSSKQALYLNLLYRSLKNDADVRRVKAFVKRLVQVLNLHQPSFICGVLFLIAELEKTFPDLHALVDVPEDNEDEGAEDYRDVRSEDAGLEVAPRDTVVSRHPGLGVYDGRKRDPEHSNAHRSCLWELVPFLSHWHPSVEVFAANLIKRQNKLPKPELASHSLIHFLDKFVFRSPKSTDSKRGASIMQPVSVSGSTTHAVVSKKAGSRQTLVNSASFWSLPVEKVSAEDTFFHEYFARSGKGDEKKPKKTPKEEAGPDEEEAEEEIWEALVNSRPDVEGPDEDESDFDMEDYEDSGDEDLDLAGADVDGDDGQSSGGSDDGFQGIFEDSEDEDEDEDMEDGPADNTEETGEAVSSKGKHADARKRRKEMKALPTFASADDYAEMLAAEDEGM
ncbi:CBF/Mak21 family-domain-containing protein [Rhypophila decipiens]|uniref:CBF/Mak21 family-domain-containing protein n=1 Tax=Rhypophila decipiens TaxID=261697 RepID=A0AAN6XYM9_9PEZI|nr:CBF/Mak21 family-domain-containing protein [Rhypophila decipiens]